LISLAGIVYNGLHDIGKVLPPIS